MAETLGALHDLRRDGVTIGMWWGRASQVSGGWNSGRMWPRDTADAEDVAFARRELQLAAERKIDEVGLDAWKVIPLWERYPFLKTMQTEFPSLRFITEQADCDIVHTIAPAYLYLRRVTWPPVLADWLNPGHETWVQMGGGELEEWFERIRRWGLVPVCMGRGVAHEPPSGD
jgi:hypothetical protein